LFDRRFPALCCLREGALASDRRLASGAILRSPAAEAFQFLPVLFFSSPPFFSFAVI
jgi:hypothetical protein